MDRDRALLQTKYFFYMKEKGNVGQPYQNISVHIDSTCIFMHLTITKIYLSHIENPSIIPICIHE
jgi:hypothetical protein